MFLHSLLDGLTWYPTLFDTPLNAARSVAIWLSFALLIAYLVCSFTLKADKRKAFSRIAIPSIIGYVCVLCGLFLILTFIEDGSIEYGAKISKILEGITITDPDEDGGEDNA